MWGSRHPRQVYTRECACGDLVTLDKRTPSMCMRGSRWPEVGGHYSRAADEQTIWGVDDNRTKLSTSLDARLYPLRGQSMEGSTQEDFGDTAKVALTEQEWYNRKLSSNQAGISNINRIHVLRLKPNEDLFDCLLCYARMSNMKAASILSAVGSLRQIRIRYANRTEYDTLSGYFEIVSLVGNIDFQKSVTSCLAHVHASISDGNGLTIGGHIENGNLVYTTCEITIVEMKDLMFTRAFDAKPCGSGYDELKVEVDCYDSNT